MSTLLLSHHMAAAHASEIGRRARETGRPVVVIALPADREARLPDDVCATVEAAFFSVDVFPDYSRQFFSTVRKAPKLLARNVPLWAAAQREHKWDPMRLPNLPRDIEGQTAVVLGLGHIGREIARLARVLGLTVIGVRRSPRQPDDPVDEMHAPERLSELLPRADWLIVACPLTPDTRGLIDADLLARLPAHARLINIARGEIVDEPALIEALRDGRLAGAYLDVFQQEPLPENSPLWDLPNVLVTPHNAGAALGNDERVYEMFLENLARWQRGEALLNEVTLKK